MDNEVIWARPERRARGPKPAHNRAEIAAAGIRVATAEGLDAVTMRRVATELGTGTTSLYRYVAKKEDIYDLMVDAALGEQAPPPSTGDWRTDLTAVAHQMRAGMLRHPWLGTLSAMRPSLGPNSLRWMEFTLSTLSILDLTADEMFIATTTVTTYVLGSAVTELAERAATTTRAQWMAAQGAYGDALTTDDRYPLLARIMVEAELPHRENPAESLFVEGLSRVLDGLGLTARPAPDS